MDFLEVENVVKQFAGHRALDRVSLTVPENTVYGLLVRMVPEKPR